jgi:uncharacterized protein YjbI with pentapeptide repeats
MKMKKFYTAVILVLTLLTSTRPAAYASADGPVGADCTEPPNLVPFADLRNCDLSGRNMEGVDLSNADLTGANLDNASLFTSNLVAATFDNASLRNTNLEDGYAPGGSFINADLRGANLYFAFFRGGDLSGANFSNQYMSSVDFESAILQNAVFTGSFLFGVDMRNSDLRGADLSFTSLAYVSLDNADFREATLLGAERGDGVNLSTVIWGNTTCADGSNSDDNDGDNFTCEGNFPENVPPTITLTSPADGSSAPFGETITISADAADSDGAIRRVEFYADDALLVYDVVAPYSFDWTNASAGPHEIYAIAYDDNGIFAGDEASAQSETVTVIVEAPQNNQPPTVTITSPANNATVNRSSGTTINTNASDSDGTIAKVEFYAGSTLLCTDTSAPYRCFWRPTSRGNFTLTAKAFDDDGAVTTSAAVTVRVR